MGRSGNFFAANDALIFKLLNDPDYQINRDGTIWTCICTTGKRSVKGVWRKTGYTQKNGYRRLMYQYKHLFVHRVVWAKYGSVPLSQDLTINHLHGTSAGDGIENLEHVTQKVNNLHAHRDLGKPPVAGNAKLTWDVVRSIRADRSEKAMTLRQIAEKYGISSKGLISEIINHKIWIEDKPLLMPKNHSAVP